ncbi:hypothetical protein BDW62DRAFT_68358 [Aspergillus aurantiobrunneus]
MASITCHRQLSSGGYDHYGSQVGNSHNNSPPIHLAASTLAATPLYSKQEYDPSSSLAVPSLDIPPAVATDRPHSCHSLDFTGGVYLVSAASDSVKPSTKAANNGMVDTQTPPSSEGLRTPKRKRAVSPPSTKSPGEIRSTSRSTRRSGGHSRQSSLHSYRRTNTITPLTPSLPDSPVRRENLLALHRESCRLFQDYSVGPSRSSSPPYNPPGPVRTFSESSSSPVTPIIQRQPSTKRPSQSSWHQEDVSVQHVGVDMVSTTETKPTIIEWTSPSTRRREYKEIDRASSGVRGLWRRVAPRWCQFGGSRVPFFKEGEDGKANYEGSVRRFRMDLPDEPSEGRTRRGLKLKPKLAVHAISRRSNTGWL